MLEAESLFPASRREFIFEMYLTIAMDAMTAWACNSFGFILALAVIGIFGVFFPISQIAFLMLGSALAGPVLVGMLVLPLGAVGWEAIIRVGSALSISLIPALLILFNARYAVMELTGIVMAASAVFLIAGAAVCYLGYEAWVRRDFV